MSHERRRHERHNLTGKVVVERELDNGGTAAMSVYLRDMSIGGFSGTYFGKQVPRYAGQLFMRHDDGGNTAVRLVWSERTLDCIHMLGFELVDQPQLPVAS